MLAKLRALHVPSEFKEFVEFTDQTLENATTSGHTTLRLEIENGTYRYMVGSETTDPIKFNNVNTAGIIEHYIEEGILNDMFIYDACVNLIFDWSEGAKPRQCVLDWTKTESIPRYVKHEHQQHYCNPVIYAVQMRTGPDKMHVVWIDEDGIEVMKPKTITTDQMAELKRQAKVFGIPEDEVEEWSKN